MEQGQHKNGAAGKPDVPDGVEAGGGKKPGSSKRFGAEEWATMDWYVQRMEWLVKGMEGEEAFVLKAWILNGLSLDEEGSFYYKILCGIPLDVEFAEAVVVEHWTIVTVRPDKVLKLKRVNNKWVVVITVAAFKKKLVNEAYRLEFSHLVARKHFSTRLVGAFMAAHWSKTAVLNARENAYWGTYGAPSMWYHAPLAHRYLIARTALLSFGSIPAETKDFFRRSLGCTKNGVECLSLANPQGYCFLDYLTYTQEQLSEGETLQSFYQFDG